MVKKKKNSNLLTKIPEKYYRIVIIVLLVILSSVLVLQNNRINSLVQENESKKKSQLSQESEDNQKLLPACERTEIMSTSNGPGSEILKIENGVITIEGNSERTFRLCDNVRVYDVVNGGYLNKDVIKPGIKIWFKVVPGDLLKEIEVVSQ